MIRERALQFGPGRRLLGILSLPETIDPARPAIIMPNTGFEHRVGPHRLHVHLCRAFAQAGFAALRLDLSGMGDSDSGQLNDPIADQGAAMDELARLGIATRCIPIGLCSGGHDAHRFAKADPRAVAAGFLDHYLYSTRRSRRISLWQKLSELRRVLNFLQRRCGAFGRAGISSESAGDNWFERPDRRAFQSDVDGFIQRGMPLFFLFTGEYQNVYNYPEQLLDICPRLGDYELYHLHYFAESDHTFSQSQMRRKLIDALLLWLNAQVLTQLPHGPRAAITPLQPAQSLRARTAAAVTTTASVNQTRPQTWAALDAAALTGMTRKLGADA
ncbi:MAG: hypothetical protein JWQ90_1702 [Hydrocarboniphaga sp.]|nr:hypothetical protein [Hydrocarboniphaga sp.]